MPRFDSRPFLDANGAPVKIGATYYITGLRKTIGPVRVVRFFEPISATRTDNRAPDTAIVENHGGRFPVTTAGLEPA